jgi:hypothetical protein
MTTKNIRKLKFINVGIQNSLITDFSNLTVENITIQNDLSNIGSCFINSDISCNNNVNVGNNLYVNNLSLNSGNLYIKNNVGIGIENSLSNNNKLHIFGDLSSSTILLGREYANNKSAYIKYIQNNSDTSGVLTLGHSGTSEYLGLNIKKDGNVGIGKIPGNYSIDISGSLNFSGSFYQNNSIINSLPSYPVGSILKTHSFTDNNTEVQLAGNLNGVWVKLYSFNVTKSIGTNLVVITNISPHYLRGTSWASPSGASGADSYEGQIVMDVYSDSDFSIQSSSGDLQINNNAHNSRTYIFVNLSGTSAGSRSSRISTMSTFTTENVIREAKYVQIYIKIREGSADDTVWIKGVTFIVHELRSS